MLFDGESEDSRPAVRGQGENDRLISLRQFEAREILGVLGATLPKNFFAALLEREAATIVDGTGEARDGDLVITD